MLWHAGALQCRQRGQLLLAREASSAWCSCSQKPTGGRT